MKISNVVIASMISASFFVNCKSDKSTKIKSKAEIEKIKQDSIAKADVEMAKNIGQNCPACGMG